MIDVIQDGTPVADEADAQPETVDEAAPPAEDVEATDVVDAAGDDADDLSEDDTPPAVDEASEAAATNIVPRQHGDVIFYQADSYSEFPNGDGVMRCEAGDYVVSYQDGSLAIMPPSVFAEQFPDVDLTDGEQAEEPAADAE